MGLESVSCRLGIRGKLRGVDYTTEGTKRMSVTFRDKMLFDTMDMAFRRLQELRIIFMSHLDGAKVAKYENGVMFWSEQVAILDGQIQNIGTRMEALKDAAPPKT